MACVTATGVPLVGNHTKKRRVTNPPTDPALLDALAADFLRNKFNIRRLVRTILLSRTYQLSAQPNLRNDAWLAS